MKKNELVLFAFLLFLPVLFSACDLKDRKTTLEVIDAERHYYPVLRGQQLDIVYKIQNTGNSPLFIDDIKTSCGCVLVDEGSFKILPAGGKGFIKMKYDSSKNIGYVKHYVTIYANLENADKMELSFDLNVVSHALYTRDYEELYGEYKEKHLVDGDENNLGYYMGDAPW